MDKRTLSRMCPGAAFSTSFALSSCRVNSLHIVEVSRRPVLALLGPSPSRTAPADPKWTSSLGHLRTVAAICLRNRYRLGRWTWRCGAGRYLARQEYCATQRCRKRDGKDQNGSEPGVCIKDTINSNRRTRYDIACGGQKHVKNTDAVLCCTARRIGHIDMRWQADVHCALRSGTPM